MKELVPDQIKRPLYKFKRRHLNKGALPTFIIIGTMKGGTSSLHGYLDAHPQISMSMQKETDFFLKPDHGGHDLKWYKKQFDAAKPVRGETSPNYTKRHLFPDVPKRIHDLLPNIRLIYLVRDPIERAISNFIHAVQSGRRDYSMFKNFFNPPKYLQKGSPEYYYHKKSADYYYINTSNYYYQIKAYLEYYPIENFLFVASEDLKNKRRETLRGIFEFLGVDATFDSDAFDKLSHVTTQKAGSNGKIIKPKLTDRQFRTVEKILKPDIDKFRELTGKSFSDWSV